MAGYKKSIVAQNSVNQEDDTAFVMQEQFVLRILSAIAQKVW